jgi:hypothetical protein
MAIKGSKRELINTGTDKRYVTQGETDDEIKRICEGDHACFTADR